MLGLNFETRSFVGNGAQPKTGMQLQVSNKAALHC